MPSRPATVYVRSAFENKLRTVCEDPKKISADRLWHAIIARHAVMVGQGKEFLDPGIIPGIEATRSQVLNRLAHDGGVGLTRQDMLPAIDSMQKFRAPFNGGRNHQNQVITIAPHIAPRAPEKQAKTVQTGAFEKSIWQTSPLLSKCFQRSPRGCSRF